MLRFSCMQRASASVWPAQQASTLIFSPAQDRPAASPACLQPLYPQATPAPVAGLSRRVSVHHSCTQLNEAIQLASAVFWLMSSSSDSPGTVCCCSFLCCTDRSSWSLHHDVGCKMLSDLICSPTIHHISIKNVYSPEVVESRLSFIPSYATVGS
jgi:hypothetical protein